jgi:hypothetical protein
MSSSRAGNELANTAGEQLTIASNRANPEDITPVMMGFDLLSLRHLNLENPSDDKSCNNISRCSGS